MHPRFAPHEESKPQPFLGVVTQSVPPALGTQLSLPEGFGLLVEDVLPESPAAQAGLQKHDILKLLNDQQLISPEQLATLVRAAGKDTAVTLTIIRKGQEQKITAKIAEEALPAHPRREPEFFPQFDRRAIDKGMERMKEGMREHQEKIRQLEERSREELARVVKGARRFAAEILPEDVLKDLKGGGPKVRVYSGSSTSTWDTGKARVNLKDNDGEIEVKLEDGKRTMVAKDPQGTVVFEGPIDTEAQRQAVPEPYRKKLDQVKVKVHDEGAEDDSSAQPGEDDPHAGEDVN